ncbi:MAG: hypothetical protein ACR2FY_24380 [Pirellulaceae bacterium]
MIRYTVVWNKQTSDKLAELWLKNLRVRQEITDAANDLDRRLVTQPHQVGEPFSDRSRYVVSIPLSVLFRISEVDATVRVFHVQFWEDDLLQPSQ